MQHWDGVMKSGKYNATDFLRRQEIPSLDVTVLTVVGVMVVDGSKGIWR